MELGSKGAENRRLCNQVGIRTSNIDGKSGDPTAGWKLNEVT